jgi:CRP-like cAMP-binding protein
VEWRLFAGVPEAELREMLSVARRRRFSRGEIVFHEGDPADSLHLVVKGRFAVRRMTPLGSIAMLAVRGPGEAFGELALLGAPDPRAASIAALEPAESLAVHRREFDGLVARRPAVMRVVASLLAEDVRRTGQLVLEAYYVPAERRVRRRLLELARSYGEAPPFVVPLKQEDIAELAGTSRATVNRVLRAEHERGTVELRRGAVVVVEPDALARRAGRSQ